MLCPTCGRPMRPLFISMVCDYCDGLAPDDACDRGYVVWRHRPFPAEEYVFSNLADAELWRAHQKLHDAPIVIVLSPTKFR